VLVMMNCRDVFAVAIAVMALTVSPVNAGAASCGGPAWAQSATARICPAPAHASVTAPAVPQKAMFTPVRREAYCEAADNPPALLVSSMRTGHPACASALDD
jgi:hypothetical protein